MKLEVGMYVRTEYGISKIVNIFFEKTGTFIETDNGLGNCNMSTRGKLYNGIYILEEDYKTFIDNNVKNTIIDLVQVGDYVNEIRVGYINKGEDYFYALTDENTRDIICGYDSDGFTKPLDSIVTKEQMEAMQYKVV